jgi:hypothetical protein
MVPNRKVMSRVILGRLASRHSDIEDHVWFEDLWMFAS